jgi:S-DNA-T family DNA segregation ATPase FtsK/SpoIIIE
VSSKPGAAKTLELLDSLKSAVREFAGREDKLELEFRARMSKERRVHEAAIGEHTNRLAAETGEAEAAFQTAKEAAVSRYGQLKSRISEARARSKEQALEKIDSRVGQRKYELQKKMLQSERTREAGLASTATAFAEFKSSLAKEQAALVVCEKAARDSLKGYGKFLRLLSGAQELATPDLAPDANRLLGELRELLRRAQGELDHFQKLLSPRLFRYLPVWLLLLLSPAPIVIQHFGVTPGGYSLQGAMATAAVLLGGVLMLYFAGKAKGGPLAAKVAGALGKARKVHDACLDQAEVRYNEEIKRIKDEFINGNQTIDQRLKHAVAEAAEGRVSYRQKIDERTLRVSARNERLHRAKLARLEQEHARNLERVQRDGEARQREVVALGEDNQRKLEADRQAQWQTLEAEWKSRIQPIYQAVESANATAEKLFPAWDNPVWEHWTPPLKFEHAAKFARLEVDVDKLSEATLKDKHLVLPGPSQFPLALSLTYPQQGSILFETTTSGREDVIGALNNIILRLLSTAPPGRLNFTVIDPVGLGQNFAGVMHLADYEERLINSRIWTQSGQIEQKLADLNEHMEKIIQMYLRNEYETIAEYNEQAGDIAEKYHFLVVADFPVNFTETAAKRLLSIAASGARCGVYTLIHWDNRQPLPQDFVADEFRKSSVCISHKGNEFLLAGRSFPGANLLLDAPPTPDFATEFINQVGRNSRDSSRVEVPFSHVAPPDAELWTEDTTGELRVPIGRTGATKLQYLAIGKGTRQHALMAGKTGSGKSTLFHVIITNLALWCSPEQVEFYLVDFKKGVEFKCYAAKRLPHARVVAIESDREFGLSVLQRVDDELKRRGDLFRKLGAQDIAGYKRAGGTEPIPRTLLMIDEFQEFFVEDDKVSQGASVLLDRIVRQGRAFGIHVLLGSQTLGGAYTLARTTLGQMVIRIALQCNEADAYLIMDDSNPAPRLLSRPGEGIYNDTAGSLEGNSPFQAVWLPDEVRDSYLDKVQARASRSPVAYAGPIVFEGNAPADVRENALLRGLLAAESIQTAISGRLWLGAPNSIKGPTEAVFQKQSGNNLLIVGQRDEAVTAIVSIALVSLAAQYPLGAARFMVLDGTPPDSPQSGMLERVIQAIPHKITLTKGSDLAEIMNGLAGEMKKRAEDEPAAEAPATFLFIHGLQKYKKLRYEEDFSFSADAEGTANAGAQLNNLICEGASLGFHVIATCDTYNNVNRFLSRKALSEFEMRVLFQMSANDSASLIDSPKANTLGLHRALFYNEQEGYLEVFRPYAPPDNAWMEEAATSLRRLVK